MPANVAERIDDERLEPREPVFHRTRVSSGGDRFVALVVNLSPGGLMARCEAPLAPGDALVADLPLVGTIGMEVRWALAGRIGCRFDAAVPPAAYAELLTLIAA